MSENVISKALSHVSERNREEVARHLIAGTTSLMEALERLNQLSGGTLTLFVTDSEGKLFGSVTDGDIRRALISGHSLTSRVEEACKEGCMTIGSGIEDALKMREARRKGVVLLPITRDGYVESLIDLSRMKGYMPIDAILMAGGRGERLRPLTDSTPKPLLPVGGRPIIDHNLELLEAYGARKIYVTVNYLSEKIEEHIKEYAGKNGDMEIKCVKEPYKTGTIGSLALIEGELSEHVLVMNSDLLTDINFEEMLVKHLEQDADITIAVTPYIVSIPFAIMEHTGDRVTGLTEKPTYNYYANAGIYIIRREIVENIAKGSRLDAPELIEQALQAGKVAVQYVIDGKWTDIGSPDDYRHACEMMGT